MNPVSNSELVELSRQLSRNNQALTELAKQLGALKDPEKEFAYGRGFGPEGFANVTFPRFKTFTNFPTTLSVAPDPSDPRIRKVGFRVKLITAYFENLQTAGAGNIFFYKNGNLMDDTSPVPCFCARITSGGAQGYAAYQIDADAVYSAAGSAVTFYGF
jgi:hypothetical protein